MQLTLKEVAAICGVSYQLIHKFEMGAVQITSFRLWQLANVLQFDIGDLFRDLGLDRAQQAEDALSPPAGPLRGRK